MSKRLIQILKTRIHIKKETCTTKQITKDNYKKDLLPIQTHQTPMFRCQQSQTNQKRRTHFKKNLQKRPTSCLYIPDTNDSLSATSKETYTYHKIQLPKRPITINTSDTNDLIWATANESKETKCFQKETYNKDFLTIYTHQTPKLALSNRKQVKRDVCISKRDLQKRPTYFRNTSHTQTRSEQP